MYVCWKPYINYIKAKISKSFAIHQIPIKSMFIIHLVLFLHTAVHYLLFGSVGKHLQNKHLTYIYPSKESLKGPMA